MRTRRLGLRPAAPAAGATVAVLFLAAALVAAQSTGGPESRPSERLLVREGRALRTVAAAVVAARDLLAPAALASPARPRAIGPAPRSAAWRPRFSTPHRSWTVVPGARLLDLPPPIA